MQLLPTTMVGSYPRPAWFTHQLAGKDVLEAFKLAGHAEAFHDATRVVIKDQEDAGLDILSDGQMWFDDYHMGIGSFLWYWLERTQGFGSEKLPHPARDKAKGRDIWALDEAGGVAVAGPIERGPVRLRAIYEWAQRHTQRPIKACVGAGPVQLATLAHFHRPGAAAGAPKNRYELSKALADVFRAEIGEFVAAGCKHVQLEDLGAWMPHLSGDKDWQWVQDTVDRTMAEIPAGVERSWHFCMGNAWGNKLEGMTAGGYREVLPHYHDTKVDAFVLDFACREMADADLLRQLPDDKRIHAGVIDVRTLEIEHPEQVAERTRKVLKHIDAARVTLTTDCGLKQLPRVVAIQKLRALAEGAAIVRREARVRRALVLLALAACSSHDDKPAAPPLPTPGAPPAAEEEARSKLVTTPCDDATLTAMLDSMVARNAWADLKTAALSAAQTCPQLAHAARYLAQADAQLHDDITTEELTGTLIAMNATDGPVWAWRGDAEARTGALATAIADDRQAIALALDATAAKLGVDQLVAAHADCDADRARAYAARFGGGGAGPVAHPPSCAAEAGTGVATLKASAKVTVGNAVPTTMDIDRSLGTTIITHELAARAGIVATDVDMVHAASRGKVYVGSLARATIKIDGAAAQNVDVMVTDQLPAGTDGIVGLSFLWHFAIAPHDGGGFTIGPPP